MRVLQLKLQIVLSNDQTSDIQDFRGALERIYIRDVSGG